MNDLINKIAEEVKPGEELKFAVVVDDLGKRYGIYDISTDEGLKTATEKLVANKDNLPAEIRDVALGVINTHFMTKNGSEYPLFTHVVPLDVNVIDSNAIDWSSYWHAAETEKRAGHLFNGKFLPLDTPVNIKAAADFFEGNAKRFPGKERIKFATAIKKNSRKNNIPVTDTVEKYAFGTVNPDIYDLIDDRIKLASDYPETRAALEKIKEDANVVPVEKTAEALDVVDHMLPFSMAFEKHGSGVLGSRSPVFYSTIDVPDAYETAYGVQARPETLAERAAKIPEEKLGSVFTEVFILNLKKNPEFVIKTATPEVVSTLKSMID